MRFWHGCLGRGEDLHMAQLIPLPLQQIQIGTFLVPMLLLSLILAMSQLDVNFTSYTLYLITSHIIFNQWYISGVENISLIYDKILLCFVGTDLNTLRNRQGFTFLAHAVVFLWQICNRYLFRDMESSSYRALNQMLSTW